MIYYYDEEPADDDQPQPDSPDIADLYQFVDQQLNQRRPERYVLTSTQWMDSTVDELKTKLLGQDYTKVITRTAWGIVKQREGIAKRRTARFFREMGETGQAPIGWGGPDWQVVLIEQLYLPVPINEHDIVRLGALGIEDLTECELFQKRREEERAQFAEKEQAGIGVLCALLRNQIATRVDELTFE